MKLRLFALAVLSLVVLLLAGTAAAQTSPNYDLSWHVVAGGGREGMTSGTHTVHGTLGQLAIGPAQSAEHALGSGYWYGIRPAGYRVYLPLVFKGDSLVDW